jgi:hypothetical protein
MKTVCMFHSYILNIGVNTWVFAGYEIFIPFKYPRMKFSYPANTQVFTPFIIMSVGHVLEIRHKYKINFSMQVLF